jgi:hypothetical protein
MMAPESTKTKMKPLITTQRLVLSLACLGAVVCLGASEKPSLNPHLQSLQPLLGKTWKGAFKDSKPDKPVVDVSRWERALNGQAVRSLHSINQGMYGGETLFIWDEKKQTVAYYYFTTAGFMTAGTMEIKDGKIVTHEDVKGDAGGVTEVRATSEIQPDGKFHVKADYLKNGQWTLGHEVTYQEDAASEVVFK